MRQRVDPAAILHSVLSFDNTHVFFRSIGTLVKEGEKYPDQQAPPTKAIHCTWCLCSWSTCCASWLCTLWLSSPDTSSLWGKPRWCLGRNRWCPNFRTTMDPGRSAAPCSTGRCSAPRSLHRACIPEVSSGVMARQCTTCLNDTTTQDDLFTMWTLVCTIFCNV